MAQKRVRGHDEYMAFLKRIDAAMVRRLDVVDIEHLRDYAEHSARANDTLNAAVVRVYRTGHSWTEIAAVLGLTRQGARQRFAKYTARSDDRDDGTNAAGLTEEQAIAAEMDGNR